MFGYNPQTNIDRINQQIQELERIRSGYQNMPQQPIQNIINTNTSNIDFEARYLKENEEASEILVQRKTAFIDLKNGKLIIKEINGDLIEYGLILPKDEKDKRIEELERKLKAYELEPDRTNTKKSKSSTNDNE